MSTYTNRRDKDIRRGATGVAVKFTDMDNVVRMWSATEPVLIMVGERKSYYCPACHQVSLSKGCYNTDCPREALRPLLGEETR